ncbi:MAG: diaminopimelate epimerase [Thermomonas sp.]|uniref:diaminopimelate epimerase n=1 Tax=Thermomonas sp. TaxID=1971895 RepID=UPI001ED1B5DC|nr:diaminopimelate epimerase [Thermomonas sp.]MBV2208606.1 diaminopimelate epimerase [Thermomonas sp.]
MHFCKMHGAGNDFVVLDLRSGLAAPSAAQCQRLADRHFGVGCDQILTVEPAQHPSAIARYRIWNADGTPSGQCGNGARCIAAWLVRDGAAPAQDAFVIESPAGLHHVHHAAQGGFTIDMGAPQFAPAAIPLHGFAEHSDYSLTYQGQALRFGAVSMGNPHAVIEVGDLAQADVAAIGPWLQQQAAFPQSANIGFAQVLSPNAIKLRVYERGSGETLACGSGACAAVASLVQRGRLAADSDVHVQLPGGTLHIRYDRTHNTMLMSGPAAFVFEGTLLEENSP